MGATQTNTRARAKTATVSRRGGKQEVPIQPESVSGMKDLQGILIGAIQAQEQGRLDEAIQLFREALEVQPGQPAACYSLGVIAMRGGQYAEAARWAEVGIAAAPRLQTRGPQGELANP